MTQRTFPLAARFGEQAAQRRHDLGWSRARTAEEAGVSPPCIERCEAGMNISLSVAVLIAAALGISLDRLYGITEAAAAAEEAP